ncbi:histone-like nucleoid-structuring protein Lsr2 [Kitasatospora sp. NPDC091207]|uniref:Lsr2 family DNA-binding protein n=1 Tax=Kitasatospora sp. NPDC091207 TaxID=3364083 RepID=UPI0038197087
MRTTVLVPVEKTFCDAHLAKDGSQEEATESLSVAGHAWDLCLEHGVVFTRYLMDTLGVPGQPEASPVAVEPTVTAAKVDHQDDAEEDDVTEAEPMVRPSGMVSGEIPGYAWSDARHAVRNLGHEVVGRADSSTVLIICGEGEERATKKLQAAVEFGIPCFDASKPGAFRDAVCAGEFKGGDPLPKPVRVDAQAVKAKSEAQAIRDWAKAQGCTVNAKGAIPASVRHAYRVAAKQAA